METQVGWSHFTHTHTHIETYKCATKGADGLRETEGKVREKTRQTQEGRKKGKKETEKKEAFLTCSHWVRYCHSDKSRYDSPFLLTCRRVGGGGEWRGGGNRVSQ